MRRFAARFRLRASAVPALLALAVSGCVTRGTHDRVVAERDVLRKENGRLEERVELLEASNRSLGAERLALIDEMEDLREKRGALERDVRKLQRSKAELSESLRAREVELASRAEELDRLHSTYEALVADLESEVAAGEIEIEQLREGLRLNVSQDILFPSGSAELNAGGEAVLRKVSVQLKAIPHRVEVQGHTDTVPIRGALAARFPTNWELAGARASRVVRLLAEEGVDPNRLISVSYGEFAPVASNRTPEGRAKNRRIEIRLQPQPPEPAKPADADATP